MKQILIALGIIAAFAIGFYVHTPSAKLGSALYTPTYTDYSDKTQATTTLAAFPGTLHTVIFGNPVAGSVVTICDSATSSSCATVVATLTIPSTTAPFTLTFDNQFTNGLTVYQATATSTITFEYQQQ